MKKCDHSRLIMIWLVIILRFEDGLLTWFCHLTLVIDFRYGKPFVFICTRLLKHDCLIITSANCQHESHRAPAASPNWITKWIFPHKLPRLTSRVLLLFLGATIWVCFPNSHFVIFTHCCNHVVHQSYVGWPCNITNPVIMSLLWISASWIKFCDNIEFLILRILFPNLDSSIHTTRDKTLWSNIQFLLSIFLLVNLLCKK